MTTLRLTAPQSSEFKHPLAKYSFRALYADSAKRGQITPRELGTVYSRDILGEPGSLESPALRLLEEFDGEKREVSEREKEERTLEELLFYPGDYLCVSVVLPKGATTGELAIKGSSAATTGASNGWRSGPSAKDGPWGFGTSSNAPVGRGSSGHWRGGSDAPSGRGRGGGRFGTGGDRGKDLEDRDRNRDRRIPPPRSGRDSPPRRGYGRDRRSRSRSRSRGRDYSPPRRRDSRY